MKNTPLTIEDANALTGTSWALGDERREITRIEGAEVSPYDHRTILANVFWRKPGGKERTKPTPLTTFRTWLNKASRL